MTSAPITSTDNDFGSQRESWEPKHVMGQGVWMEGHSLICMMNRSLEPPSMLTVAM